MEAGTKHGFKLGVGVNGNGVKDGERVGLVGTRRFFFFLIGYLLYCKVCPLNCGCDCHYGTADCFIEESIEDPNAVLYFEKMSK